MSLNKPFSAKHHCVMCGKTTKLSGTVKITKYLQLSVKIKISFANQKAIIVAIEHENIIKNF
jgi:hypothetical protein